MLHSRSPRNFMIGNIKHPEAYKLYFSGFWDLLGTHEYFIEEFKSIIKFAKEHSGMVEGLRKKI